MDSASRSNETSKKIPEIIELGASTEPVLPGRNIDHDPKALSPRKRSGSTDSTGSSDTSLESTRSDSSLSSESTENEPVSPHAEELKDLVSSSKDKNKENFSQTIFNIAKDLYQNKEIERNSFLLEGLLSSKNIPTESRIAAINFLNKNRALEKLEIANIIHSTLTTHAIEGQDLNNIDLKIISLLMKKGFDCFNIIKSCHQNDELRKDKAYQDILFALVASASEETCSTPEYKEIIKWASEPGNLKTPSSKEIKNISTQDITDTDMGKLILCAEAKKIVNALETKNNIPFSAIPVITAHLVEESSNLTLRKECALLLLNAKDKDTRNKAIQFLRDSNNLHEATRNKNPLPREALSALNETLEKKQKTKSHENRKTAFCLLDQGKQAERETAITYLNTHGDKNDKLLASKVDNLNKQQAVLEKKASEIINGDSEVSSTPEFQNEFIKGVYQLVKDSASLYVESKSLSETYYKNLPLNSEIAFKGLTELVSLFSDNIDDLKQGFALVINQIINDLGDLQAKPGVMIDLLHSTVEHLLTDECLKNPDQLNKSMKSLFEQISKLTDTKTLFTEGTQKFIHTKTDEQLATSQKLYFSEFNTLTQKGEGTKLGSGSFNTTYMVEYETADSTKKAVFKPDKSSVSTGERLFYKVGEINAEHKGQARRAIGAAAFTRKCLPTSNGNLIVGGAIGVYNGQFGCAMDMAPGIDLKDFKDKLLGLPPKERQQILENLFQCEQFRIDLEVLQLTDGAILSLDRWPANLFIDVDINEDLSIEYRGITGIDNDLVGGLYTDVNKLQLRVGQNSPNPKTDWELHRTRGLPATVSPKAKAIFEQVTADSVDRELSYFFYEDERNAMKTRLAQIHNHLNNPPANETNTINNNNILYFANYLGYPASKAQQLVAQP